MTELERIQKQIDACNKKQGCDKICSKEEQWMCPFLQAHEERRDYCRKNNIPIIYW